MALSAEVPKHCLVLRALGRPGGHSPAGTWLRAPRARPRPLPWRPRPRPARPSPPPPQDGGRRGSARGAGRGRARRFGRRRPQGSAAPRQRPPAQRPGFAGERAEVPPPLPGRGRAGRSRVPSGAPQACLPPGRPCGERAVCGAPGLCPPSPVSSSSFSSHAPLEAGKGRTPLEEH